MTLRIFSGVRDRTGGDSDDLAARAMDTAADALRPVAQVVDRTTDAFFASTEYFTQALATPFVGPPVSPIEQVEQTPPPTGKAGETKTADNAASPDAMLETGNRLYQMGDPQVYDNILSQYHSPIANWRFFVTSDSVLRNNFADGGQPNGTSTAAYYRVLQQTEQITIVETGATGYNIKEVVIESVVGTTTQNRAMNTLSFILRLTEPYGTTLIDSIIQSCVRLNVPNWRLAPFHLELTFKGISPETGQPVDIPFRRIWAVSMFDLTCTFDTGTVNYEMLLMPYNHVAFDSVYATLKKNEMIAARTLGDALTELCKHMTENPDRKEAGGFQKNYVEFGYRFHAETLKNLQGGERPDDWVISPNMMTGPALAGGFKVEDGNNQKTNIHFGSNSRFEQVVELLIAVTKEGHNMLGIEKATEQQQSRSEPGSNTIGQTNRNDFYIFRIDPEVTILGYNRLTGDYNKRIIYHIYFFEFNTVILDHEHVRRLATRQGQEERWKKITKRINKRYDYTYTGLNTDVLDLRMEMNMLWKLALPFSAGQYGHPLVRDGRFLNEANWKDVTEARLLRKYIMLTHEKQKLDSMISNTPVAPRDLSPDRQEEINQTRTGYQNRLKEVDEELTGILSDQKNILKLSNSLQSYVEMMQPPMAGEVPTPQGGDIGTTVAASQRRLVPKGFETREYAEDYEGSVTAALAHNDTDLLGSLTVAFTEESARESTVNFHLQVEGEHQPSRTIFGSLLNQVFQQSSDFLEIELQIRGDPWWLGADTYQILHFAASGGKNTENPVFLTIQNEQPTANFLEHSHMFFLRFGTPVGYSSETGLPQLRPGGMFEGVYEVTQIRSQFDEQGKFIQTLTAKRDNLTVITPLTSGDVQTTAVEPTAAGA